MSNYKEMFINIKYQLYNTLVFHQYSFLISSKFLFGFNIIIIVLLKILKDYTHTSIQSHIYITLVFPVAANRFDCNKITSI